MGKDKKFFGGEGNKEVKPEVKTEVKLEPKVETKVEKPKVPKKYKTIMVQNGKDQYGNPSWKPKKVEIK